MRIWTFFCNETTPNQELRNSLLRRNIKNTQPRIGLLIAKLNSNEPVLVMLIYMKPWINMNELVVIIMTAGLHFLDGSSNVWFFNCLWLLHRTHPKKVDHGHQLKVILSSNHGNFLGIILVKQPFKSKVWKYNRIKNPGQLVALLETPSWTIVERTIHHPFFGESWKIKQQCVYIEWSM